MCQQSETSPCPPVRSRRVGLFARCYLGLGSAGARPIQSPASRLRHALPPHVMPAVRASPSAIICNRRARAAPLVGGVMRETWMAEIVRRIRRGADIDSNLRHIEHGDLLHQLRFGPDTRMQYMFPYSWLPL
ncbi:hypothetical protein Micbo1qcDRAFT_181181 [Microdochium bolleyi]|uniref:Uncharacterized protein n=1 Tax=Microdochium bolleyi TaxID=196109 RepID=A0A136IJQ4_9PEZI|nr:hypothetical protein Micbo1qcDRAFT_181181 [Microdochium bolleyi]